MEIRFDIAMKDGWYAVTIAGRFVAASPSSGFAEAMAAGIGACYNPNIEVSLQQFEELGFSRPEAEILHGACLLAMVPEGSV